jgi:hypothetical protein
LNADGYDQLMRSSNLTNQFLIAMPGLADPNFYHTVTYICAHNDEGAMGIVINRPLEMALGDILAQMDMTPRDRKVDQIPVYHGGPVHTDRGLAVRRNRWLHLVMPAGPLANWNRKSWIMPGFADPPSLRSFLIRPAINAGRQLLLYWVSIWTNFRLISVTRE